MSRSNCVIALVLLLTFTEHDAARILAIFPTPSISHQVVFRPLTQELARRGHEVTVLTTDPVFTKENSPANFTEINLHDVSYKVWVEELMKYGASFGDKTSLHKQIELVAIIFGKVAETQMKTHEVQKLLKKEKDAFDLLIIEDCAEPYLMFSHFFKAPVITISSMGMTLSSDQIVGAPGNVFLYPTMYNKRVFNLTFWEKLEELHNNYMLTNAWRSKQDEVLKKLKNTLGFDVPPYSELSKNIDMLFLNMHPLWINNRPLPPNVISIWGIHKKPEKALPQDLQSYLDSSKNGVIYLSFGSNVPSSMLPPEIIQIFIKVFSKLPYDVLWKWETDELPGKPDNVRISKWLPQSDLLRHPKLKLFITQGGLQSTDEAIRAGVPLVGIPMIGDQWYNVDNYVHHRIGARIDFDALSEVGLDKAIKTVINDKSYRENILRIRSIMKDQPESALERAVWWTEYVLRHGGAKHLWAQGANKTWAEYYDIEFMTKLASLVILFVVLSVYILYSLLGLVTASKSKPKTS
ncbi:UDP-glucosyltransferase 2-like [Zerene cesonia]|uniref:UDP-glucosyltransferase 2-like n=1 Tax=Zerene cesonia TaxID=33412 RepID=UPI0018E50D4D|nr:UDP-glucosyltransferase 2-like [Zerene cesonia]